MPPRPSLLVPRALPAVALGASAFLLVAFFGTGLPAFDPGVRLAAQILFVVPLAIWAVLRLRGPRELLDWAILGGLALALAVALLSLDQTGSMEALGLSIAFALLFWAMRDLATYRPARAGIASGVTIAITLWLLIAAFAWISQKIEWIQLGGGLPNLESGPIPGWSSANTFPVLVLLGVPFLYAMPGGLAKRALISLYAGASLVVIPFSVGRAAYLGMAVALVTFELLRGAPLLRGIYPGLRRRRLVPAAALAVLALLGGLVASGGHIGDLVASTMTSRWRLWEQAASIFAERPIAGGGTSTFHWLRLEHTPDYTDRSTVYLAHNVVVQTAADGGLLLLAALAIVVGTFGYAIWRRRSNLDRFQRLTLAVLIGFTATSLLDDMSLFNAVTAMVVTLAAWAVGPARATSRRTDPLLPIAVGLLAVVTLPAVMGVGLARAEAANARRAAVQGNWSTAAAGFEAAGEQHAVDGGYRLGLGLALAQLGDEAGARAAYREAMELAAGDPRPYGALAALSENADERARLLDLAARRTIHDPQYAYRLGITLLELDRQHDAVHAMALAVAIEPRLFGVLPSGVDRSAVADALPALLAQFQPQADIIGPAAAQDVDLARSKLSTDAPPAWRAVAARRAGDTGVTEELAHRAIELGPYDPRAYQAAAYSACDPESRERALMLAARLGGDARPPSEVREAWDDAYREQGLGDYQPPQALQLPELAAWPIPLVGPPPPCE